MEPKGIKPVSQWVMNDLVPIKKFPFKNNKCNGPLMNKLKLVWKHGFVKQIWTAFPSLLGSPRYWLFSLPASIILGLANSPWCRVSHEISKW